MDLGSESSVLESVEDNSDGVTNGVKFNGPCLNEIHELSSSGNVEGHKVSPDRHVGHGVDAEGSRRIAVPNSPSLISQSPLEGSPPPTTKGKGLKKWRRIKRDIVKDAGPDSDSSKALKRGLLNSGNVNKPTKPNVSEPKHHGEDSVGSVDAPPNATVVAHGVSMHGRSTSKSKRLVGAASVAWADSENSDDWSSKSSMASSAPRMRNDLPLGLGFGLEKIRIKNMSAKSISTQRVSQGKEQIESSMKARGERVKVEKENSHSSMESDSRSSKFVFTHGAYSVTSNGRHGGISLGYKGENAKEAQADDQQFFKEIQTSCGHENTRGFRDDLATDASSDCEEENGEDRHYIANLDPLAASIRTLQSVQEALEAEVQRLGELGKHINTADTDIPGPSSSDDIDSVVNRTPSSLEFQVSTLMEKVKGLETQLDEANSMMKVKESRIAALEIALNADKSIRKEAWNIVDLKRDGSREVEHEIEDLYKQKIEAEVEYVALTKTLQMQGVAAGDPVTLLDEQESPTPEQASVLGKVGEVENKAALLEKQAEELQNSSLEILAIEEVLKMEKKVYKFTSCFCIQLILLILVFLLLFVKLFYKTGVVVPT